MLIRRGASLAELLIAISVGGVVIALSATLGWRQQRFHRELGEATDRLDQVGQTAALLPIEFRAMSPASGDVTPGQARDTAIQFRSTIGSAVVCDTVADGVVLAPVTSLSPTLASFTTTPLAGDTLWWLAMDAELPDSLRWSALAIQSAASSSGGCTIGGTSVYAPSLSFPRTVLRFPPGSSRPPIASPIRITRLARYSLYKSSDGGWYLGAKEWNPGTGKFNGIQPVSGPFLSAAKGGLAFRYLDSAGAVIAAAAADTRRIALIEVTLRSDSGGIARSIWFSSATRASAFSVAARNRAR